MSIPIITRVNTIDEWRIQTNQEATALNNLETGTYIKSNGVLTLSGNSSLVITANGTSLQVSNNALFQSNVEIGKDVSIGVQSSATGNVTIGGVTVLRGPGAALQVANNALVNTDLQVTRTIYTGNVSANGNVVVGGNTTIGKTLSLTGTGQVLNAYTGSAYVNTATVIDSTLTNTAISNAVVGLATISVAQIQYSNTVNANIANANITSANIATGNITTAVITTGNVLTLNANQTYANTINAIGITVSSNAYINKLSVSTTANITGDLGVTANIYGGNITTTGTSRTGSFVVTNSANIGGSAFITSNVQGANLVVTGHSQTATLRTSGVANVGSGLTVTGDAIVSGKADITSNVNAGNAVVTGHTQTGTLRTSGVANVGSGLTVTGNAIVSNVVASGLVYTNTLTSSGTANLNNLNVTANATVGTTLNVTGNTTSGNMNTTGLVHASTIRTTGRADIGGILTAGATTLSTAYIDGNMTVNGNFILAGSTVIDTNILILRANTPQSIGSGYDYFGVNRGEATNPANANSYIRWNEPNKYWDIRDVDNPSSYSKIVTANLISDTLNSTSSSQIASSNAANTLNVRIETANTNLKNYTDFRLTSTNAYIAQANTDLKNYADANFTLRAVSANSYALTTTTNANTSLKAYVDGTVATASNVAITSANTSLKAYVDGNFLPRVGGTITSDLAISGNLTVSGSVTYINTQELNVGDAVITLNSDLPLTTAPSENAGIEVNRGTSSNTKILWNESLDKWTFTNDGVNYSQIGSAQAETVANTADQRAVTSGSYANSAFAQSNTANQRAVTSGVYANSAYTQANTATTNAATADQRAVTSGVYANSAYTQANTATTNAATADQRAVTSGSYANSAFVQANTGVTNAATADQRAVTSGSYANSAFVQANTGTQYATSAGSYANSAYALANTAPTKTGGGASGTWGINISGSAALAYSVSWTNVSGRPTAVSSFTNDSGYQTSSGSVSSSYYASTVGISYNNDSNATYQVLWGSGNGVYGTGGIYVNPSSDTLYASTLYSSGSLYGSIYYDTNNTGYYCDPNSTSRLNSVLADVVYSYGDVTAYYSDDRLKTKLGNIESALDKVISLNGFYYEANQTAQDLGYKKQREIGVSAQEIQRVLPEAVVDIPVNPEYLTVKYDRLVPLLIEAVKELKREIDALKK